MSNLRLRLLTAAILITLFLLGLFFAPPLLWAAFCLVFMTGGAWEWAGLAKLASSQRGLYALATLLLAILAYVAGLADRPEVYLPALAFWVLIAPLWLARHWPGPKGVSAAILGWLLLIPTFLALMYLRAQGPLTLLIVVSIAIVADSAAYFTGRALGKHKLAPAISPGKTWEGAAGGGVAVILFALLLVNPEGVRQATVPLAFLFLFVLSVLGDLFESWIKRQAGVKDSSQLLPGHGGVLDRIDSQLAVLPVAALLWILLT